MPSSELRMKNPSAPGKMHVTPFDVSITFCPKQHDLTGKLGMHQFNERHYVPILQSKTGELRAIEQMGSSEKDRLTPLFVIPPIAWDFIKGTPGKTIDAHLKKIPGEIKKVWSGRSAFIDGMYVENEVMQDGTHCIEWFVNEARRLGNDAVPVVAPSRSTSYIAAVTNLLAHSGSPEVCIRLDVTEWPIAPADKALISFIASLGLRVDQCHLVLDMRDQVGPAAANLVKVALRALPSPTAWRTLTLAGSAMPQPLPTGSGTHEVIRRAWLDYHLLVTAKAYGARRPTFGDYAVSHPDPFADVDPRTLQISAKLKYTVDDKWLVARGGLYKGNAGKSGGGATIRPVAREVAARTEFLPSHCTGEAWISSAGASGQTGNPTTWVTIGTLHHLLLALDQIALT